MANFQIGRGLLNIGPEAGQTLLSIISQLHESIRLKGLSPQAAVEGLLEDELRDPETALLKALRRWLTSKGQSGLADLLEPLNVLELTSDSKRRSIGWPSKEWSVPLGSASELGPFGFTLDVDGGLSFNLLKDGGLHGGDIPSFEESQAYAAIPIHGRVKAGAKGTIPIPYAGLKVSSEAHFKRSMTYYYSFQSQNSLTGVALGSALSLMVSPTNGRALLQNLSSDRMTTHLLAVEIAGEHGFGGTLGIEAKFPTAYGTPGLSLAGKAKLSGDFNVLISQAPSRDQLRVLVKTLSSRERSIELGVSYVVGLSMLSPSVAQGLLSKIEGLNEKIKAIDEKAEAWAGKLKTWLKPGDLIREKILSHLTTKLDAIKDETGGSVFQILRTAFGYDGEEISSDEAIKSISENISGVVAEILDEMPDLFDISEDDIAERVAETFQNAIPSKALTVLETDIFDKIKEELEDALQETADSVDAAIYDGIKKFVGDQDPNEKIDAIRDFVKEVRDIAQTILDNISSAQTDLLAMEIALQRARTRRHSLDYEMIIDVGQDDLLERYQRTILDPSEYGDILLADGTQMGLSVTQLAHLQALTRTKGHRWSIALVGLSLAGSVTERKHIEVLKTKTGTLIATNGEIVKKRRFLSESRTVNFFSAMHIYEARNKTDGVDDPNAAATISISFEEIDDNLKTKEARALMRRFVDIGLLNTETFEELETAVRTARKEARSDLDASFGMSLAIPPSQFIATLRSIHQSQRGGLGLSAKSLTGDNLKDIIISSLAEYDGENIKALAPSVDSPDWGQFKNNQIGLSNANGKDNLDLDTVQSREAFLAAMVNPTAKLGARRGGNPARRSRDRHRPTTMPERERFKYGESIDALYSLLKTAAKLYFDTPIEGDVKNVEQQLDDYQRRMNEMAKDYLSPGTPFPGWASFIKEGKVPGKTAAFFAALQTIAVDETGIKPPLMVSFKPKKGVGKTFINL